MNKTWWQILISNLCYLFDIKISKQSFFFQILLGRLLGKYIYFFKFWIDTVEGLYLTHSSLGFLPQNVLYILQLLLGNGLNLVLSSMLHVFFMFSVHFVVQNEFILLRTAELWWNKCQEAWSKWWVWSVVVTSEYCCTLLLILLDIHAFWRTCESSLVEKKTITL